MDYRIRERQAANRPPKSPLLDQNTELENKSEQYSCLENEHIKSTFWNKNQKACFILYWIDRFINFPLELYSFNAPLHRDRHFQSISLFISAELGQQYYKTPAQCKSRFASIKRKVLKHKKWKRRPYDFDLLEFVIEEGWKIEDGGFFKGGNYVVGEMIERLVKMGGRQSRLMGKTKEVMMFEDCPEVEDKNNEIFRYLLSANLNPHFD